MLLSLPRQPPDAPRMTAARAPGGTCRDDRHLRTKRKRGAQYVNDWNREFWRRLLQGTLALAGTVVAETGFSATPCDALTVTQSACEFASDGKAALPSRRPDTHGALSDLADLVDLSSFAGISVDLVAHLPPGKTGMTTGEGDEVRIAISLRYPLFVQYSTLIHELVHARDRQQGIHRSLSRAERETRALAAELSPENVKALTDIHERVHDHPPGSLSAFLRDVAQQYGVYTTHAAGKRPSRRSGRNVQRPQSLRQPRSYRIFPGYQRPLAAKPRYYFGRLLTRRTPWINLGTM